MLSITVPVYNEVQNLAPLHERLLAALEPLGQPFEIVLVNDGSTDGSDRALDALAAKDPRVKVVHFRRNYGQTAAMMAGIRYASGEIIIPMDGDLQNDPADIPKLLAKLDEGFDVVSGWRKDRKDAAIRRNLPSRIANLLISRISGVRLHDYGCSLKAYRRDVVKGVKLYGEMHRFIPIYATWEGGKVAEVVVSHHPRVHGHSKYGVDRVVKVLLDLIVVQFLARYASRPIYLFGGCGVVSLLLALVAGLWAVYLKYFEATSFIQTPLPLAVVLLTLTGGISILMGLLAEIIMRTYYESQGKAVYDVRSTANLGPDPS
ncbi:MAG TPA: glycosyltransferase family 2 protein [Usitatibacter sp.]|nr:glycosyltransferase family 2 protein [Usitatibacter sp.]